MPDFEKELRERIYELEKNTRSLEEMCSGEKEPTATDVELAMSGYANMIKAKILLEIYHQHFYNEDLIESEKELDKTLKEFESSLMCGLKDLL